ncbi:MAG TPA: DHH family phosphoesterase [Mycobacteriales bacterium]|nr:DHH family phosphoesterase [Mycobacteriales bacterium]
MSALAIDEPTWARALRSLDAATAATLICHVAPDGDALGSMLAVGAALRSRGVDVTCTWGDDPFRVPSAYSWLPGIDAAVAPADVDPAPPLLIVLDTGSVDRLGVLRGLADTAGDIIVIDHHANNAGPIRGQALVDPTAAATAVIAAELIERLGARLDVDIATCLYTGLVTDTGGFAHSVTTPSVHALAGRLLEAGVRPDEVHRRIWGTQPFRYVELLAAVLGRARLDADALGGRGLVWTAVTQDDLAASGLEIEDVDPVMDSLRQTAEADVAVVLKQDRDGSYRASTRSRGGSDVGAACGALGGGGHRLAAGFTSHLDAEATIAALRERLELLERAAS